MNAGYFVILFYVVTLGLSAWLISQVLRGFDDMDERPGKPDGDGIGGEGR